MKKSFLIPLILLLACASAAAENPFPVKTGAWPKKITVGQEIRLIIDAETDAEMVKPSLEANLSPFEIKNIDAVQTVTSNGRTHQQIILTLTIFEVGKAIIPPLRIAYKNERGQLGQIMTEIVPVEVVSVGKKKSDKDDIRPIKGPIHLDTTIVRVVICGILAALLALSLAIKIIRRRKQNKIDLESLKPPHERVALELGRLKKKNLLAEKKDKEFYSELSDILRRYLERRFDVQALEYTTAEIMTHLKSKEFEKTVLDEIKDVLENADLVKFAKFNAPGALADQLQTELLHVAEATKPTEAPHAV